MSSDGSNAGVPGGLAPIGGWQGAEPPAPAPVVTSAPAAPAVTGMASVGGTPPVAAPVLTPVPPAVSGSRFAAMPPPPTPGTAPVSRFSAPPAAVPTLAAPPPERERAYSVAGAYQRGEVGEMTAGEKTAGIFAGIFMGAFCTAIWLAIFVFTGITWATLIAPGVGYAIGWAVFKATKHGEETSCWISAAISFVYCTLAVFTIQYLTYKLLHHPNFWGIGFGIIGVSWGTERGFRTPEVMAVNEV